MTKNTKYPIARRIACLEVLRDQMVQLGDDNEAAEYTQHITALRQQADNKTS